MATEAIEEVSCGPPRTITAEEGGLIPHKNAKNEAISNTRIVFEVARAFTKGYIDYDTTMRMLQNLKGRIRDLETAKSLFRDVCENRDIAIQDIIVELSNNCICPECQDEGITLNDALEVGMKVECRDYCESSEDPDCQGSCRCCVWATGFVTSVNPLEVNMSATDPTARGYAWDEVRQIDDVDEDEDEPTGFTGLGNLFG
jgi:hypothetical protein